MKRIVLSVCAALAAAVVARGETYIAHWPFTDGSLEDMSGNGYSLTSGASVVTSDGYLHFPENAAEGTSWAQTTNKVTMNGAKTASVSFWLRKPNPANGTTLMELTDMSATGASKEGTFSLGYTTDGQVRLTYYAYTSPYENTRVSSAGLFDDDEWHFVTATINITTKNANPSVNLYVDGKLNSTATASAKTKNNNSSDTFKNDRFYFARRKGSAGTGGSFAGDMDEIAVYGRVLNAANIQTNYCRQLGIVYGGDSAKYQSRLPDGYRVDAQGVIYYRVRVISNHDVKFGEGEFKSGTNEYWVAENGYAAFLARTPAAAERVAWCDIPKGATFAGDGLGTTFVVVQPETIRVEAFAPTHVWTGDVSTEFELDTNWKSAEGEIVDKAPGVESTVFIPRLVAQQPVVSSPFTVKNLYIGALTNVTGTVKLTFENGVTTNIVSGNVRLLYGARMSHTSKYATSGSGKAWEKTYTVQRRLSLSVGGDMTIDEGAAIDVTGCGYASGAGLGCGDEYMYGGSYGGHAQRKAVYPACYGSIRKPLDYGSGGQWGTGGGSVNLVVTGDLTVNGNIRSNGNSGNRGAAGGSVFITTGTLKGTGTIEANGSLDSYGGGGGRISIVEKIAKVSQFTKNISCIGSDSGSSAVSASGTIYCENSSDEPGRGTLIVPSQNIANASCQTELVASRMPDANEPFGAIFVEKNAGLRLFAGTTCTVTRVLSVVTGNGASFTADVGSCLKFVGAGDACVTGALTFAGLECTEPGKRIVFTPGEAGKTSIKAGGKLTVRGTEEKPVELWGADGAEWLLNLDASAKTDILHVSVTNSNASSGSAVTAFSSNDLGGNQKWSFIEPIPVGEVIKWTGKTDSDWSNADNWTPARLPIETDDVRILDPDAPHMPVLSVASTTWNKLTVGTNAMLTLCGRTIAVTNELVVAGTLVFAGRQTLLLSAPNPTFADGTVVPAESTVRILDGVSTIDPGDCTFCRIDIPLAADRSLVLTDGLKARSFEVRATDNATVTFAAGKTIEADTIVCSCMEAGKYLTLQSSAASEKWFLKSPRISYMTGVRVSDSTATAAAAVASLSLNVGESNVNWIFDNGVSEWVGGASGKFDVAANWYPSGVPGATNDVILRGAAAITADGNVSVRTLALLPDEAKGSLTVNGVLTTVGDAVIGTNATLTLSTVTEFNEIGKDLVVQAGGTVTHSALSSTANTLADSRNGAKLIVRAKNIFVEKSGKITANEKGFAVTKGPAVGGDHKDANQTSYGVGAGHAGLHNHSLYKSVTTKPYPVLTGYRAYGSMFEPMTHGSGGKQESCAGGGVIRLVVTGDITVDGTVSANGTSGGSYGYSGAGGSVWITVTGALRGTGVISASAGKSRHDMAAGGGRIAIYAGAKAFTGRITAAGEATHMTTDRSMTPSPGTVLVKLADEDIYSLLIDYADYDSLTSAQKTNFQTDNYLVQHATDIPTEEDLDKLDLFKRTSVTCGRISVLNLTRDLKIYDLNFTASAASKARLNLHTLEVMNRTHKKGRGWAVAKQGDDPIATHIWPCEQDGQVGKIVWPSGMLLIIR